MKALAITNAGEIQPTRYGWEPIDQILDDGIDEILKRHWATCGMMRDDVPLDPDWERYRQMEVDGTWKAYVARRDGAIVGYLAWFVTMGLHYRATRFYETDVLFVDPEHRGGMVGAALFKGSMKDFLRPCVVHANCKLHTEEELHVGAFLERLGFSPFEMWYHQRLT